MAVNCTVEPTPAAAVVGDMETEIGNGGGEFHLLHHRRRVRRQAGFFDLALSIGTVIQYQARENDNNRPEADNLGGAPQAQEETKQVQLSE